MHDLVTLGEVLLRLSIPSPGRFETARQLDVQIGGAEANVAAACARLGLKVAWISALPANQWGERIRRDLVGHGVDCAHVRMTEHARVGLYFLEYGVPPRPVRVLYDRRESAFARLTEGDVDWEPVRRARLVHLTGITPARGEGARGLVRRAIREAPAFSFDVNSRASLWGPDEARQFLDAVLPEVRYLFLGQAEARTIFSLTGTAEQTLEALARLAPRATVSLQLGEAGAPVLRGGPADPPRRAPAGLGVAPDRAGARPSAPSPTQPPPSYSWRGRARARPPSSPAASPGSLPRRKPGPKRSWRSPSPTRPRPRWKSASTPSCPTGTRTSRLPPSTRSVTGCCASTPSSSGSSPTSAS